MSERAIFGAALVLGVGLGVAALTVDLGALVAADAPPPPATIQAGSALTAPVMARAEPVVPRATQVPPPDEGGETGGERGDEGPTQPPDRVMPLDAWDATPRQNRGTQDELKGAREELADGTIRVNFAYLAQWTFQFTGPQKHVIPEAIQALDGQVIEVEGFMLPDQIRGGLVARFYLMRHIMNCCFGVPPRINELITVDLPEGGECPRIDGTVTVRGRLEVGVQFNERGEEVEIYRLRAQQVGAMR